MSNGEKGHSLNPRVEKFLGVLRRNFLISVAIVAITLFLAAAEIFNKSLELWKELRPPQEPKLSITFLDQRRPQSTLTVNPHWKNRYGSGFSDSLAITIALQNSGTAAATHIGVHLVYPPGVFNLQKSTGASTVPGVLGDVMMITGYENVQTFNIDRIDPSPIANVFEKDLELQFRFRQNLGIPIVTSNLPNILPISLDFVSSYSKSLGEFPIAYVINYSESDKPLVGSLIMRLDQSKHDLLAKPNLNSKMTLIRKNSPPSLPTGKQTNTVDVQFFADGLDGLDQACHNENPKMVTIKAFEERNENDVWTDIGMNNGTEIVLVDRGDDGALDRMFLRFPDGGWWEFEPSTTTPYIPLSNVLKVSTSTCLSAEIASGLGIKH